ncbi:MAG: N-6 DNA methylase [Succinivibrio sp.]|nr:N-6 DNA methylase [Succinivibrio sp.]
MKTTEFVNICNKLFRENNIQIGVSIFATLVAIFALMKKKDILISKLNTSIEEDVDLVKNELRNNSEIYAGLFADSVDFVNRNKIDRIYSIIKTEYAKFEFLENDFSSLVFEKILGDGRSSAYCFSLNENVIFKEIVKWLANNRKDHAAYCVDSHMVNDLDLLKDYANSINVKGNFDTVDLKKLIALINGIEVTFDEGMLDYSQLMVNPNREHYSMGLSLPVFGVTNGPLRSECVILEHLMSTVEGRFAIIMPLAFCTNISRNYTFLKERLVKNGILKSVIRLPLKMMTNTAISTVVLLCDTRSSELSHNISFIDLSNNFKNEKESKKFLTVLSDDARKIMSDVLFNNKFDSTSVKVVEQFEIEKENWNLDPSRYVVDDAVTEAIRKLNTNENTVKLSDIAEIIRIQPIKSDKEGNSYFEIGCSNINEFGFIDSSSKELTLAEDSKYLKYLLQEKDIIFSIKGTIAKIGLVLPKQKNYFANQSFVIIRAKDKNWSQEYIFQQLMSKNMQLYIKTFSTGDFIQSLPIDKLKNLLLEIPTAKKQEESSKKLQKQLEIINKIEELKKELLELFE